MKAVFLVKKFSFRFKAVCAAVETGLAASLVLSTLESPTIDFDIPETVPVNVGAFKLAFKFKAVCAAVETGLDASLVLSTLESPTCVFVTECGLFRLPTCPVICPCNLPIALNTESAPVIIVDEAVDKPASILLITLDAVKYKLETPSGTSLVDAIKPLVICK